MGRNKILAAAVAALVILAGCSATATPASTPVGPATTTAVGAVFSDAEFYELARDDDGYFATASDEQIETASQVVCGVFTPSKGGDPDAQWAAVLKSLIALGVDARSAGGFIVVATASRCPAEYKFLPKV